MMGADLRVIVNETLLRVKGESPVGRPLALIGEIALEKFTVGRRRDSPVDLNFVRIHDALGRRHGHR